MLQGVDGAGAFWSTTRDFDPVDELEPAGRARRFSHPDGEVWMFSHEDVAVARRLVRLGKLGIGGFVRGGEDTAGAWSVRKNPGETLDRVLTQGAVPWDRALRIVAAVARAISACEREGLTLGPLHPSAIVVAPEFAHQPSHSPTELGGTGAHEEAWLLADSLVRAMVDQPNEASFSTRASPRWTPPEQADGAPWDGAASRYVLGLVAYHLIAGAHPWAGAGMRHGLNARAARGLPPPPFEAALAQRLRPGVQSFVLELLSVEAKARPSVANLVARCERLLESPPEERTPRRSLSGPEEAEVNARGGEPERPPAEIRPRSSRWRPVVGWGALVLAIVTTALAARREGVGRVSADVAPVSGLSLALDGLRAADCAKCHPTQVAEWERSVMAHASTSPLFGALESLIQEEVGRSASCPHGAGVLRPPAAGACKDERSGLSLTGSGGESWCVNCHAMGSNLGNPIPGWGTDARGRRPVRDLLSPLAKEGITCAGCHQVTGPVAIHTRARSGVYEGNPTWLSTVSGRQFLMRPEDLAGLPGISNSGYRLEPALLLQANPRRSAASSEPEGTASWSFVPAHVHPAPAGAASRYTASSEFCGACHDVRLFGADALAGVAHNEPFKRLRNAYSEWRAWSKDQERSGLPAASCQDCHMSLYPGICERAAASPGDQGCPPGTKFSPRPPGARPLLHVATATEVARPSASHYFTGVDFPLSASVDSRVLTDVAVDANGLPTGLRARRDMLLARTFRFELGQVRRERGLLEIPLVIENVGAGHRVPAGFSQEREIWIELRVTDARGNVVYEVGRVDRDDADLRDKVFARVRTEEGPRDREGRPLGMFGADVVDGPDVPRWTPTRPRRAGSKTAFVGRGLVNLQNGFLRCVRCIGVIDREGRCQPGLGQGQTRADRYTDGDYDIETGACGSNLSGTEAFFETYFPVGALDAERGLVKAPDAIIDTRSAAPGSPVEYTYMLDVVPSPGSLDVRARLRFRALPPYLVRAFAAYESAMDRRGLRPSGPQVTLEMLRKIDIVDLAEVRTRIP